MTKRLDAQTARNIAQARATLIEQERPKMLRRAGVALVGVFLVNLAIFAAFVAVALGLLHLFGVL